MDYRPARHYREIGQLFIWVLTQPLEAPSPIPPNLIPPVINNQQNEQLIQLPQEKEVTHALSSIGALKAPSPDGFPSLSFHSAWHLVKQSKMEMVRDFLEQGHSLDHLNKTNIVINPQKANASNLKDFRPISFCNVPYKIISEILTKSLKTHLPSIISPM